MKSKNNLNLLMIVSSLIFTACGGGEGLSSTYSGLDSTSSSSGVAAVGAALANSDITILAYNGVVRTTTADANGKYTFPAGLRGPVLLRSVGNAGSKSFTLYSAFPVVPGQTQIVNNGEVINLSNHPNFSPISQININPITDAIVRKGLGGGTAVESKFSAKQTISDSEGMEIVQAIGELGYKLAIITNAIELMSIEKFIEANPFTGSMSADHESPLDLLLDSFKVFCTDDTCSSIDIKSKFPLPSGVGTDGVIDFDHTNLDSDDNPFGDATNDTNTKNKFSGFKDAIASMDITYLIYGCAEGKTYDYVCSVGTDAGIDKIIAWNGSNWIDTTDSEFPDDFTDPESAFCDDHCCS